MTWFTRKTRNGWDTGEVAIPWDGGRPSIYRFVEAHGSETLPDEEAIAGDRGISWIAGAKDALFGHHTSSDDRRLNKIIAAIHRALDKPDWYRMRSLYAWLSQDDLIELVDPLTKRLSTSGTAMDISRLSKLGLLLMTQAPDRGAVKFGMAICGALPCEVDYSPFLTLGQHDEFTLYALVALINQAALNDDDFPEAEIWQLAREVEGWGRIYAVESLSATKNPEIKAWLLREGYRNRIMYEYLAHIAATTGGLVDALKEPEPDVDLLESASEILQALLIGGPAEDIDDYADGPEAIGLFLEHLRRRPGTLGQLSTVAAILRFVKQAKRTRGDSWSEEKVAQILAAGDEILAQRHWRSATMEGLDAEDDAAFETARQAALAIGIDPWEKCFERQKSGRAYEWYNLMRTDDPDRIDLVVALAGEQLSLEEIATGPGMELGLGADFQGYAGLDFVVQDLGRFPGKGWSLVRSALESPVVRHRNLAVRTLSEWGRDNWPSDADAALRRAMAREPDLQLRSKQDAVLRGRQIDV